MQLGSDGQTYNEEHRCSSVGEEAVQHMVIKGRKKKSEKVHIPWRLFQDLCFKHLNPGEETVGHNIF